MASKGIDAADNAVTAPRRRVLYPLSQELISACDLLPSNVGRSSMVHSLVYQFGLLDIGSDRCDGGSDGPDSDSEDNDTADLVRPLGGSRSTDDEHQRDALHRAHVGVPQAATPKQLQTYHSAAYLSTLLNGDDPAAKAKDEAYGLLDDCPRFSLLDQHVLNLSGAVLESARQLAIHEYDVAIVWDGGRHHAKKDKAAGFCYVNDAVLAILELKKPRKVVVDVEVRDESIASTSTQEANGRGSAPASAESGTNSPTPPAAPPAKLGFGSRPEDILRAAANTSTKASVTLTTPAKRPSPSSPSPPSPRKTRTVLQRLSRILYLDLDLHWGDGVEEAFNNTSSVLTVSIHNASPGFYPAAPTSSSSSSPYALRLPLQPSLSSSNFRRVFASCILPLLDAYEPEAIVVQCGLDGLADDPMNTWNLDLHSILTAVDDILRYGDSARVPTLLLGGGGYHCANAARGWTALTALALGRLDTREWNCDDASKADRVSADSPIPTNSPHWPKYAPSYTLDVPAGHRVDTLHTDEYLSNIEDTFRGHADAIRKDRQRG